MSSVVFRCPSGPVGSRIGLSSGIEIWRYTEREREGHMTQNSFANSLHKQPDKVKKTPQLQIETTIAVWKTMPARDLSFIVIG